MKELEFLDNVPLFKGLRTERLQSIATRLRHRRYRRGEVVFHQDDPGGQLYLIVQGQVRISIASEEGRETDIALLGPGECFGEMSLLDGSNRSATATAVSSTEVLCLDRETFYIFLKEYPETIEHLASLLCKRLRETDQLLGDVLFLDAPTRVARHLLRLSKTPGQDVGPEGRLILSINQDDLARSIGTTRETINRALRLCRQKGILHTSRHTITITDLKALQEAAFPM